MSRVLSAYVSLPVPPGLAWSATEWEALAQANQSPDVDHRYTTEMSDRFLVLKRGGKPVFLAQVEELRDGSRELSDIGCDGDQAVFNRAGFESDTEITNVFVDATRGLIDRFLRTY